MRELELQLQEVYPQFRRIWVQYSDYRGYRVCITLFPLDNSNYRMVFGMLNSVTFDSVKNLINKNLENSFFNITFVV